MKNTKYFFLIIGFILLLGLTSCGVNNPGASNNPTTSINNNSPTVNAYMSLTHDHMLTADAIDYLLRADNPGKLSAKSIYLLKNYRKEIELGAFLEDEADAIAGIPTRPVNHFWDPLRDAPLTDMGNSQSSGPMGKTALVWTKQEYTTAKTGIKEIWPIYNSTVPADTQKIITTMHNVGHVLHLFQDMTSPPHVRNDSHLTIDTLNKFWGMGGVSGYEYYVVNGIYTTNPNSLAKIDINKNTVTIQNDDDVWKRFKELAVFTNANFYSEDTIPISTQALWRWFPQPQLLSLPAGSTSGYAQRTITVDGQSVQIEHFVYIVEDSITGEITYELNKKVHKDYADILVPKAVEYTASVLAYMLKEEEKKTRKLYVVTAWNLSVIDMNTDSIINNIPLGGNTPYGVAIALSGIAVNKNTHKIYVTNPNDNNISIIDTNTDTTIGTITIDSNISVLPTAITINPKTNKIYVVNRDPNIYTKGGRSHNITVIDAASNTIINTISLPNPPFDEGLPNDNIDVNQYTNTIYIATPMSGKVYIIDGKTDTLAGEVSVVDPTKDGYIGSLKINPINNALYVLNYNADRMRIISGGGGMFVNTGGSWPISITINSMNNRLYISNFYSCNIGVLDANNYGLLSTINLGTTNNMDYPGGLIADSETGKIYVTKPYGNKIVVIDGNTNQIINTIWTPAGPNNAGISALQSTNNTNMTKAGLNTLQNASMPVLPLGGMAIF
jgi:DNA-binding beta-propeller fold protein YncE